MIVRPTRTERLPTTPASVPAAAPAAAGMPTVTGVDLRIERLVVDRGLIGHGGETARRRFESALGAALARHLAAQPPPDAWLRGTVSARAALPLRGPSHGSPEALARALAIALLALPGTADRGARSFTGDPS